MQNINFPLQSAISQGGEEGTKTSHLCDGERRGGVGTLLNARGGEGERGEISSISLIRGGGGGVWGFDSLFLLGRKKEGTPP